MTDDGQARLTLPAMMAVHDRVRLARLATSLTPEEIAIALGISLRTYYRREKGVKQFRRGELVVIATLTNQPHAFFDIE